MKELMNMRSRYSGNALRNINRQIEYIVRSRIRRATEYGVNSTSRRSELRNLWENIPNRHPARTIVKRRILDEVNLARRNPSTVEAKRALENLERTFKENTEIKSAIRKAFTRLRNDEQRKTTAPRTRENYDRYYDNMRRKYERYPNYRTQNYRTGGYPNYRAPRFEGPRFEPPRFEPPRFEPPQLEPPRAPVPNLTKPNLGAPPNLGSNLGSNLGAPRNLGAPEVTAPLTPAEKNVVTRVGGPTQIKKIFKSAGNANNLAKAGSVLSQFPNMNTKQVSQISGVSVKALNAAKRLGSPNNVALIISASNKIAKPRKRKAPKKKAPEPPQIRVRLVKKIIGMLPKDKLIRLAGENALGNSMFPPPNKNTVVKNFMKHVRRQPKKSSSVKRPIKTRKA
jgi:hypothetical protein